MLDTETGEVVNRTLMHEGSEMREFYSQLPRPVLVGIEAIGPMQWFLDLLQELGMSGWGRDQDPGRGTAQAKT
jgi:hypothetical protein